VQFMVHSSGSHWPVASQKGAMPPPASTMGRDDAPNSVPLVPSEATSAPSATAPAPSALIWLSPLPGATRQPAGRPSAAAASAVSSPMAYVTGSGIGVSITKQLTAPVPSVLNWLYGCGAPTSTLANRPSAAAAITMSL